MVQLYRLVCNQVRVAPSGDVIGLDYDAVIAVLELYTTDVKDMFNWIIKCYEIEQECK